MTTLKEHLGKGIKQAGESFVRDIEAMPQHILEKSPGGVARTPLDYAYEIALINKRIAARLRNEDPGPWPFTDVKWVTCAPEYCDKEKMTNFVRDSFDEVAKAWDAFDETQLETPIKLPSGETNALDLGAMVFSHAVYHDGQLNYAQSISGDDEMHWQD
jgi:hypothetical protein